MVAPRRSSPRTVRAGFTVVELLIVIGIIAVLAALVYAHTGPAREKARQAVCLSNLRQVGMALQMYRTDWYGSDTARTPHEYGIPSGWHRSLLPYTGRSMTVFQCPSLTQETFDSLTLHGQHPLEMTYGWNVWFDRTPPLPDWGAAVARRGGDFPLFYCKEHDRPDPDRPTSAQFVHVSRSMGSVDALYVRRYSNGWEW